MMGLRKGRVRSVLELGEWMGEVSGEGDDFAIYCACGRILQKGRVRILLKGG
jgi:hypothetical protein